MTSIFLNQFQMSVIIEQQDETIGAIQTAAINVEKDTEVGCESCSSFRRHIPH